MDIYIHLMPNMQESAAAAVDGVLCAAINRRAEDVGLAEQWQMPRFVLPNRSKKTSVDSRLEGWPSGLRHRS
jgi:hypothetical protein